VRLLATAGSGSVAKRRLSERVTVQALREEKIVRNRFTSRVGSGGQTARKAQQAGALFGGRQPSWLSGKALGLRLLEWVTALGGKEAKGLSGKGDAFQVCLTGGRAWEVTKAQESQGPVLD